MLSLHGTGGQTTLSIVKTKIVLKYVLTVNPVTLPEIKGRWIKWTK